jgi:hypothetical protein
MQKIEIDSNVPCDNPGGIVRLPVGPMLAIFGPL